MWPQIQAIVWAQFRISRNHLPRAGVGSIVLGIVTLLWYGIFAGIGVILAIALPELSLADLRQHLPVGLLVLFLYAELIPLFTLSGGWSLQLNKLQMFPIPNSALFSLEVLLRVTASPEILLVLAGAVIGMLRRPDVPFGSGFCLVLILPLILFIQLALRNLISAGFGRGRLREVFAVLLLCVGFIPQILIRSPLGAKAKPYFLQMAHGALTPWNDVASLALGAQPLLGLMVLTVWTALAYWIAQNQFKRTLVSDASFAADETAPVPKSNAAPVAFLEGLSSIFKDPAGAVLQKEFQSLVRMPRFRVVMGMAVASSLLMPLLFSQGHGAGNPVARNYFPIVNLYGLLILADLLLLNIFGPDRLAAQVYFAAPVSLKSVIKAKNLAAAAFVLIQNLLVLLLTALLSKLTLMALLTGFVAAATATIHLTWIGNLTSVIMPRPIDPSSTLKKQANSKTQFWLMLCTVGLALMVGVAYFARWAFDSDWALLGIFALEFAGGLVAYFVSLDSTVARAVKNRETILTALSASSSPLAQR